MVSTLLCGLAPTYETLLAARALAGAFGGVAGATVHSIIGDAVPEQRRGQARQPGVSHPRLEQALTR